MCFDSQYISALLDSFVNKRRSGLTGKEDTVKQK